MADFTSGVLGGIMNPVGPDYSQASRAIGGGIAGLMKNQRASDLKAEEDDLRDNAAFALAIKTQPLELRNQALATQYQKAVDTGDNDNAESILELMNMDNPSLESSLDELIFQGADFLPATALQGAGFGGKSGLASAKTETYPNGTVLQAMPDGSTQVRAPDGSIVTDPNQRIKVLEAAEKSLAERAKSKAASTVEGTVTAESETSDVAADTERKLSNAKESGKQESILSFKPRIIKAVKLAERASDDEAKLAAFNANMPLMDEMAVKLRALSSDATHTFSGKAFDLLAKESGLGATKGSTARAKYQAIIDNQVLPLLKATFGAAFTAAEGQRLAATLGDVDASPAEKMAQLDAFMEAQAGQKRALESKLNPSTPAPLTNSQGWGLMTDANGNRAYVGPNGEIEEVE